MNTQLEQAYVEAGYARTSERVSHDKARRIVTRDYGAECWDALVSHLGVRPSYRVSDVLDWLGF